MIRTIALSVIFVTLLMIAPQVSHAAPDGAREILLTGNLTKPSGHSPQWICYEFLTKIKRHYGIQDPQQDLKVVSIRNTSPDRIRILMQQLLFETPVWGASLSLDMDTNGVIHRVEGTFYPGLEKKLFHLPMHPAISAQKAVSIAKSSLGADNTYAAGRDHTALYYLPARPGCPLVYAVSFSVRAPRTETLTVFVHSLTKRAIAHISESSHLNRSQRLN
ncbi:hypothetical protein SD71_09410 [Cohnella kolymensis]|uniref:Uncharacterized protein n=1 Tax=Cohnella kolymensis TaxID=1590652 RepID=A0ABR5A557_9BACL|nr:hypothetical protein [Cohnella kolymensis]KIL36163.1 hypothetical protein SD71_09410 [Cohnella kolymensis]